MGLAQLHEGVTSEGMKDHMKNKSVSIVQYKDLQIWWRVEPVVMKFIPEEEGCRFEIPLQGIHGEFEAKIIDVGYIHWVWIDGHLH